jgi:hypothetical protein
MTPANLKATAGDGQVSLNWTPSTGAESYIICRQPPWGTENVRRLTERSATSFTDTGLTNGSPYCYTIRACNASGESDASKEVSATPLSDSQTVRSPQGERMNVTQDDAFRQTVVKAAAAVMRCEFCRSHAPVGDQPQPGRVGIRYTPGRGIVVLLQNPGAASEDYSTEREQRAQLLLQEFSANPSIATHASLMRYMFADMAGENGGPPWAKWTHPVRKLVSDRERFAWMNVVKFRTPGTTRKDDPVTYEATQHGVTAHLQQELDVLQPKAVVAFGNDAGSALRSLRLPATLIVHRLKLQGASAEEVRIVRRQLLMAGADI